MFPVAVVALLGLVVAAVGLTKGPDLRRVAAGLGFPLEWVQSASRWALLRRVPLDWVLTTIIVESNGKPHAAGDADGRSKGLMQVNAVAHAKELAAAGLTAESLYDPFVNIEWGTKYMREFYDGVLDALGGRTPPIPIDQIVRLSYKGPKTIYAALRTGQNPATIPWAPQALRNWNTSMARVRSLTGDPLRV